MFTDMWQDKITSHHSSQLPEKCAVDNPRCRNISGIVGPAILKYVLQLIAISCLQVSAIECC